MICPPRIRIDFSACWMALCAVAVGCTSPQPDGAIAPEVAVTDLSSVDADWFVGRMQGIDVNAEAHIALDREDEVQELRFFTEPDDGRVGMLIVEFWGPALSLLAEEGVYERGWQDGVVSTLCVGDDSSPDQELQAYDTTITAQPMEEGVMNIRLRANAGASFQEVTFAAVLEE